MLIKYLTVEDFIGWSKTEGYIKKLISENKINSILEIGAGANPTLNSSFIREWKIDYTISDIDDTELRKADDIYKKLVADFSSKINITQKFDLVFSRMVGEHINNGEIFHNNIYKVLNKGGVSFHCFSTLYALPFIFNRFLPDRISDLLLAKIAPRDTFQHGKFKAHYDWCRGPSTKMISRFENIGFEIAEYVGYFGHNYYKKIPLLNKIEILKSELLKKYPVPFLTSYAHIVLKKASSS